ncbi:aminoglycoside phosphotransferase [Nocardia sp. NRRL S-836]|uniref:maltokinase N-terminal cap-like domain-containing protein n=1 Tax=Nocardia sp. NRRL S-836 TaxID=1519492 RepID=UPI0006B03B6D|nr:aminoglycoside phosphotransferase [Nocardia sp. NRRL S-836]KOV78910.1 aminoglycoside phosphotransferase [Nocardia sp. NRRL S-836]
MIDPDELADKLVTTLPDVLPTLRWFGGKDRAITAVRPLRTTPLADDLVHVVVEVEQPGRTELYQLVISEHSEGFDATADPERNGLLLEKIAAGERVNGIEFAHEQGVELRTALRGRPIGVEQSNTSLIYGQQYILKIYRKLARGENRDLVMHRALRSVGCEHIARPLGSISTELDGEPVTLAMLQEFLPDAVEGWDMAKTSVRDLMAEADLHAFEVGGDFAGEAHRLGSAVAKVHADLAEALGSRMADDDAVTRAIAGMQRRLNTVLEAVPELGRYSDALRSSFDEARRHVGAIPIQHVHGDLHLGQVLRTVHGWLLIDFEGEPAAGVEERNALRSPLRDVAGMLRSFDYAARQLLVGQPDDDQLAYRAMEWTKRNRAAFCDGYAEVAADPRDNAHLLRAFELDKAVYEVAYEHANRPEWLTVPLSSIARMTSGGE